MKKIFFLTAIIAVCIYMAVTGSGCSEDTIIEPGTHFNAEGMIILTEDFQDTVLYVFRGQFKPGFDTFKVPFGTISPHYNVFFLNSDTVRVEPPAGSQYSLGYTIANPLLVEVYQDDPQGEPWAFHLRGLQQGTTSITLKLVHISHADFTTPAISVVVDPNIIGEPAGYKISEEKTGRLIYRDSAGIQSGPGFVLSAGDTTEHTVIQFYDKSGNLFTPPYPQYDIAGLVQNSGVAVFINEAPAEPFVFRIIGVAQGTTGIFLQLLEGSKVVFTSRSASPVTVN